MTTTVPVDISPTNKAPTVTKSVGTPNTTTGIVTGAVKGTDGDRDLVTYPQTAGPTKGTVTLCDGRVHLHPDGAGAARRDEARCHDRRQAGRFTVTVDDGHGGIVNVTVTVKVALRTPRPPGAAAR